MNLLDIIQEAETNSIVAENTLRDRYRDWFQEIKPPEEGNGNKTTSIFCPQNIFYIEKQPERNTYKVHLLYPIKVSKINETDEVDSYKVSFSSIKEILNVLKSDFIKVGNGFIVPRCKISQLNTQEEFIVLKRLITKECLTKHHLVDEKKLNISRTYLKNIKGRGLLQGLPLSASHNEKQFPSEIRVNGKFIINPLNLMYIERKDDDLIFWIHKKDLQLMNIKWKTRLTMENLLLKLNLPDVFLQIHPNYIVNIYALLNSPRVKNKKIHLQLNQNSGTQITLPVSPNFFNEVTKVLISINYDNFENKLFEICNFERKKTDQLLKAMRKKEINIIIIEPVSNTLPNTEWQLLGEREHIGKIYPEKLKHF